MKDEDHFSFIWNWNNLFKKYVFLTWKILQVIRTQFKGNTYPKRIGLHLHWKVWHICKYSVTAEKKQLSPRTSFKKTKSKSQELGLFESMSFRHYKKKISTFSLIMTQHSTALTHAHHHPFRHVSRSHAHVCVCVSLSIYMICMYVYKIWYRLW